jgi:hypothetical protein
MSIKSDKNDDLELDPEQAENVMGGKKTKATRKTRLSTPASVVPHGTGPSSAEQQEPERSLEALEQH